MTDKIRKTIYLAKDIVQAIKIVAVKQNRSETKVIEDILRKNLEGKVKFKIWKGILGNRWRMAYHFNYIYLEV